MALNLNKDLIWKSAGSFPEGSRAFRHSFFGRIQYGHLLGAAQEAPGPFDIDCYEGSYEEVCRELPKRLQGHVALFFKTNLIKESAGSCQGGSRAIWHCF